jgi:hypothetical protein
MLVYQHLGPQKKEAIPFMGIFRPLIKFRSIPVGIGDIN